MRIPIINTSFSSLYVSGSLFLFLFVLLFYQLVVVVVCLHCTCRRPVDSDKHLCGIWWVKVNDKTNMKKKLCITRFIIEIVLKAGMTTSGPDNDK